MKVFGVHILTCTQESVLEAGFYNSAVIKSALSFLENMAKIAVIDPNLQAGQEEHFLMLQPLTAPHFLSTITMGHKLQNSKQKNPAPITTSGMK